MGIAEISRVLGTHVLETHATRVDLKDPELVVPVEVIPGRTYCDATAMEAFKSGEPQR